MPILSKDYSYLIQVTGPWLGLTGFTAVELAVGSSSLPGGQRPTKTTIASEL
jgi:hypothetical protein